MLRRSWQMQAQNLTKTGPKAKKIAKEKNIDLNSIDGSGKGGRVTKLMS